MHNVYVTREIQGSKKVQKDGLETGAIERTTPLGGGVRERTV